MSIGIQEVLLVLVATIITWLLARRLRQPWLMGIPAMIAVVSCTTPADPFSTLMISIPCCSIYTVALFRSKPTIAHD